MRFSSVLVFVTFVFSGAALSQTTVQAGVDTNVGIDSLVNIGDDLKINAGLQKRWGRGRYTIDDNTYHRSVKPELQTRFRAHYRNFVGMCGNNPDYFVDNSGWVYPGGTTSRSRNTCTKNRFYLDASDILNRYI